MKKLYFFDDDLIGTKSKVKSFTRQQPEDVNYKVVSMYQEDGKVENRANIAWKVRMRDGRGVISIASS